MRRLLVIGVSAACLMLLTPLAAAASHTKGAKERACSDTRCQQINSIPAGSNFSVSCWRDGGQFGGTARWFRVTYKGSVGWISASQLDSQDRVPYCSNVLGNEELFSGQSVFSENGSYRIVMQPDGNLVLYQGSSALWATGTSGSDNRVIMQPDGNLVVYSSGNSALWQSGTMYSGATMSMQNDANMVIYQGNSALWASSWHRAPGNAQSVPGTDAERDQTQCTYYALEWWKNFWARHQYPNLSGNAAQWPDAARRAGWPVYETPMTQGLVIFPGTSSNPDGHVAWIDAIQPRKDGTWIHVWERNYNFKGSTRQWWYKHVDGMEYIPSPSI